MEVKSMDTKDLRNMVMEMQTELRSRTVKSPADVLAALDRYRNRRQEHFVVVTLDGNHGIIRVRTITKGLVNRSLAHPREVFRPAILDNAVAVVVAHNHPSGNATPSPDDDGLTEWLRKAGACIGIEVLDHIIVSGGGHYSYLEGGRLPDAEVG